jgi:hypothetical protein
VTPTERTLIINALAEYGARRRTEARSHRWAGPAHTAHRAALRAQAEEAEGLAGDLVPKPGTVVLPLAFKVGTLQEIGLPGLQVPWMDGGDEATGTRYDVTCGAGVGNGFVSLGAVRDGKGQYARASILDLTAPLFTILEGRLDAEEVTPQ